MDQKPCLTEGERQAVEEFRRRHRTAVLALLFTDIVGSTELKRNLGDAAGTERVQRCHSLLRGLLGSFREAEEISTAGDSVFVVFVKPSDAVRFALQVQHKVRALGRGAERPTELRLGMHMGEVFIEEKADGALDRDVLGVQVDTAARVMSLARGGQILMSRSVFDSARTILTGESLPGIGELSWVNHGPYLLKGLDDPLDICEVGEREKALLQPPTDAEAGKRATVAGAEPVLGWRPAVEQLVPGTEWELERPLGEGGFGEVWLARHRRTKQQRVFKFCFRADRLRSLKREMTLFRVLKEVLGERNDIARLYEVQFEEAPFYLEIEYTTGGNLADWIESGGGFDNVAMELRLEIVAQVAEALAAAHSVGVIHKDIKPPNVLIEEKRDTVPRRAGSLSSPVQVRLTDFGIGQLLDREALIRAGITASGFTETIGAITELSSRAGTRLYMAPELMAGHQPSIQSDVYSLGVLLYQMIIGDFSQPMTTDWERRVEDPLLRDDLRRCLAGDSAERFGDAAELAQHIRALPERRAESARRQAAVRAAARRRHAALAFFSAAGLLVLLALALGYGLYREKIQRNALLVEMEKTQRQLYYANIGLAEKSVQDIRYENANRLLAECPAQYRHWEWGRLLYEANPEVMTLGRHDSRIRGVAFSPDGKRIATNDYNSVRFWDAQTGREISLRRNFTPRLPIPVQRAYTVRALAFTSQEQCIALQGDSRRLVVQNLEEGRRLAQLGPLSFRSFSEAALSEDGRTAVIRGRNGSGVRRFAILDARSGEVFELPIAPEGQDIQSFALSRDGTRLAFALETSPTVMVLDTQSRQIVREFRGRYQGYRPIGISRDGSRVAIRRPEAIEVWDVKSGREIGDSTKQSAWRNGLALSPDGTRVASYDLYQGKVVVWDVETGQALRTIEGYQENPDIVVFSPDSHCLLIARGDTARVWDIESRGEVWKDGFPWLCSVDFSPDNEAVALAAKDRTLTFLSLDSREEVRAVSISSPDLSEHLGITGIVVPDRFGRSVATFEAPRSSSVGTGTDGFQASASGGLPPIVWDLEAGREMLKVEGLPCGANHVALSGDGKRLATTSVDCRVHVFDVPTGTELRSFSLATTTGLPNSVQWSDTGTPRSLAFDRDARRLAAANSGTVKVFDLDGGSRLFAVEGDYAAFSRDGQRLATVCDSTTLKIWDAQTGDELQALREHNARCLAFSPDGKRLISGGRDTTVKVWDVEQGRELVTLRGLEEQVLSLAVSADGRRIAAADTRTAAVWDTFPWTEDAYESLEERIRQSRIDRWRAERKRLERARAYAAESAKAEQKVLEVCAANLRTIHTALGRYRNDHDGRMPDWWSDLSPGYLTSQTLLCPANPEGTSRYYPDPELPCSYSFEFTTAPMPPDYHAAYGKTYRLWKEKQLKELGDIVPVARCMHHGEQVLSLSYGGKLFLSPLTWEQGPRQDYSTTATTSRGEEEATPPE